MRVRYSRTVLTANSDGNNRWPAQPLEHPPGRHEAPANRLLSASPSKPPGKCQGRSAPLGADLNSNEGVVALVHVGHCPGQSACTLQAGARLWPRRWPAEASAPMLSPESALGLAPHSVMPKVVRLARRIRMPINHRLAWLPSSSAESCARAVRSWDRRGSYQRCQIADSERTGRGAD